MKDEAWRKRNHSWIHNSMIGKVVRAYQFLCGASEASSVTPHAQKLIAEACNLLRQAEADIRKYRVELDGSITDLDVTRAKRCSTRRV